MADSRMDITAHCIIIGTIAIQWLHASKFMPCGREEGRQLSLTATGDLSGSNVGQIACTHAPKRD